MFDCSNFPPLPVPSTLMAQVMRVESNFNPYAIGVVGGRLARQPRTLSEAVASAQALIQMGKNFSVGIAQVNLHNLQKYGLSSLEAAFSPCQNIQAGARILAECYQRAHDWGKALSCYYSGNFSTGFRHGYVQKVLEQFSHSQPNHFPKNWHIPSPPMRQTSHHQDSSFVF